MRTEQDKGDREREIFLKFLKLSRLPFNSETIEKRNPPEPDILCEHNEEGPIAFELVELCDSNIAEFLSNIAEGGVYYMRTCDPSTKIITKKLQRSYQTKYPIELLCYTENRIFTPGNVIVPTISQLITSMKNNFRRSWLLSHDCVQLL